ncbi:SusC/RagA family TonB-linked outer membrane protein [Panacibacter sp. DH6]|uniref:SusC/RagA family TonB-linked outer membrane protein n=1 Tax=Panacibacter microcysteis TaxID=2793269 RepID=A0A931E4A5_9BACT|nr:SusC/RagA family TonB-linked outer membrane protein [Panacibacter microcysteis]MBG9374899.1 SusC/RagA family TonB-linked outer membrane protein [Panacibacter microcysteis]
MKKLLLLFAFIAATLVSTAQNVAVTGKVSNSAGSGIEGINVLVKGSSKGTITKADGSFNLSAPSNGTLVFSGVGYAQREIAIDGQSTINVTLSESQNELNTVVVTALGVSKQARKLGYAVTSVSGDAMNKARETNIANSLGGQVAGLSVRGTNSGPGGTSKLLLRGLPSMTGSGSPLFVINGIPMDNSQRGSAGEWGGSDNGDGINNINPDDVESITVLKGQAASALYGSRATNGVIMITTKGGKKGRKDFSVEYNLNYMADMAMNLTDFQYVYGQGDQGAKPATQTDAINTAYSAWGPKLDGSQILGYDGKNYTYSAVKDNIQNFYQTGNSLTNSIALSKSSETGSFRIGLTYLNNTGIVRNSGLKRYSISLNADQNITEKLSVQAYINFINQESENIAALSDAPMNVNNVRFLAPNIDQATLAPGYDLTTGLETVVGGIYSQNPWFVVNKSQNNIGRKRMISSVALKYNFTDWLYAQARVGYDLIHDNAFKIEPWGTAYRNTTVNNVFASGYLQNLDKSERFELNVDGIVGASKKFNSIEVNALVGANLRKNQYSMSHLYGGPFIQKDFYSYNNLYNKFSEYDNWATEVHSAYYSIDATYNNFLTLGTTGRYDAYSTLPVNNNTVFVPAVTGGFIFSELLKNPGILQFGKLRASYASTSNELSEAYRTQIYYSLQTNNYNGIPLGTYDLSLPNGLLKPFVVNEIELGTELHFFKGKLNLDVAWFTKKTKNEIMGATISRSSGYGSGYVSTGSTKNSGIEILISGTVVKSGNFSWKPSLNITKVQNKILSTTEDNSNINLGQARETLGNLITAYVVGLRGPQILGYDYRRDAAGNIVVDGSGIPLAAATVTPLGSVLPTFYGGFNNEFTLTRDISFSFLVDYNFGNKVISMTSRSAMSAGLLKETLVGREGGLVVDGVTESGEKNTTNVSAQSYYTALASRITALHVKDGDFVKLRQVALTYNFPAKTIQRTKVFKGAQLSFTARNLFILYKKAENIDPEESFGSSINYYGIEGRNLPSARSIGVNLKVTF